MDKATIEQTVTSIFSQYIKKDFTSRDDFFALGANSLEAVQVVLQLEKTFRIKISDAEVKNLRTVADITTFIAKKLG